MHDLNTIIRLNTEAFADSIANHRRQGRFVLAKYEGLHLSSIETFTDARLAQDAFDTAAAKRDPSGRTVLFAPVGAPSALVPSRDQSEDRKQPYSLEQLAALGRTGEKTLGDYIARKEGSTGGVPVPQVNEN